MPKDAHKTIKVDVFARVTAIISLMLGIITMYVTIRNSALQDLDALQTICIYEPTDAYGTIWPRYPIPDSIKRGYTPLGVTECDLTNAGRRDLSVRRFAVSLAGGATVYAVDVDSSVAALPMDLYVGQTLRKRLLFASDTISGQRLYVLAPSGKHSFIGYDPVQGTDSAAWTPTRIAILFSTGLGASVVDTVLLEKDFGD